MTAEIRRLKTGDEETALQVVRELMPLEEREGREPGLPHFRGGTTWKKEYI